MEEVTVRHLEDVEAPALQTCILDHVLILEIQSQDRPSESTEVKESRCPTQPHEHAQRRSMNQQGCGDWFQVISFTGHNYGQTIA